MRQQCAGHGSTYGEEEIANIVRDVDGNADIREVKPVAKTDEGYSHAMVTHELLEVLAALLDAQQHDDGLLHPEGGLEQVVELEARDLRRVREALVHAPRVEVPHRSLLHAVHAEGPGEGDVESRVHLLHEAQLLASRFDAEASR